MLHRYLFKFITCAYFRLYTGGEEAAAGAGAASAKGAADTGVAGGTLETGLTAAAPETTAFSGGALTGGGTLATDVGAMGGANGLAVTSGSGGVMGGSSGLAFPGAGTSILAPSTAFEAGGAAPALYGAGSAAAASAPWYGGISDFIYNPSSGKVLGMTGTQLAQQAALQGGSALLQSYGANQQADARKQAFDSYNAALGNTQAAQDAAWNKGVSTWQNFGNDLNSMKQTLADEYNATKPNYMTVGQAVSESTPEVVKSDLANKDAATKAYSTNRMNALADLNSVGSLMQLNAGKNSTMATDINNYGKGMQSAKNGLDMGLTYANRAGAIPTALGGAMSGVGNLLMASQLSKK